MRVSGKRKVKATGKERQLDEFGLYMGELPEFRTRMSPALRDELVNVRIALARGRNGEAMELLDQMHQGKRRKLDGLIRKPLRPREPQDERYRLALEVDMLQRLRKELQKSGRPPK